MSCPNEATLLSFIEGQSPPALISELAIHLDECGGCRNLVSAITRIARTEGEPVATAAQAFSSLTGERVGRFVVEACLGTGGMGVVYAAYDSQLDRRVALKLVRTELHGPTGQTRLLREARLQARLAHPNIVSVHEAGTWEEQVFIAMELVEGSTLRGWLAERPRTWREVVSLLGAAGEGLAAAHERSLLHRDFKPDNILIGNDGRPRVSDFGLAASADRPEENPVRVRSGLSIRGGTPAYAAPEVLSGGPAGERSDQYSFCLTLYEALCRRPYVPGQRIESIPRWLRSVLERGLQAQPSQRFPSMRTLLDALSREKARRRRLVAAVALAVLTSGGMGIFSSRRPDICDSPETRLAGIWDMPREQALREHFHDQAKFTKVKALLDHYRGAWLAGHREACEQRSSERESLHAALSCLDGRARVLGALVDVLTNGDAQVLSNAAFAIPLLPEPDACARRENAGRKRGDDLQLQKELARVQALIYAGSFGSALELGEQVELRASALNLLEVKAQALYHQQICLAAVGRLKDAVDRSDAAVLLAIKVGLDDLAAGAAAQALTYSDFGVNGREAFDVRRRLAEALVDRTGDPLRSADLLSAVGYVAERRGEYEDAIALQRKTLELRRPRLPPDHPWIGTALGRLGTALGGAGRHEEALTAFREDLALRLSSLSPEHPMVLRAQSAVAGQLAILNRNEEVVALLRPALALQQNVPGPLREETIAMSLNLGEVLIRLGAQDEGLEFQRRAVEHALSQSDALVRRARVGEYLLTYCEGLSLAKRRREALSNCRRSATILQSELSETHPLTNRVFAIMADLQRAGYAN
ncbi:MAG: protein kinase domain-containing protein [Myxococcaceae bacterium]